MTRVNGRDGEEARELGRVPEEEVVGAHPAEARRKALDDWSSGTEDPAFFIKPAPTRSDLRLSVGTEPRAGFRSTRPSACGQPRAPRPVAACRVWIMWCMGLKSREEKLLPGARPRYV